MVLSWPACWFWDLFEVAPVQFSVSLCLLLAQGLLVSGLSIPQLVVARAGPGGGEGEHADNRG